MDRNRVTVRYAKALFEMAAAKDILLEIDADIRLINNILKHEGFRMYITVPKISADEKHKKVASLLNQYIQPLSSDFIKLVFKNKREIFLPDICRNFIEISKKHRNILTAKITLADELNSQIANDILQVFEKRLNATIEMEVSVDKGLIGGFAFTISGWQYDASVAASLKKLKKQIQQH